MVLEADEELVQVWVPRRDLAAVYQRIAELELSKSGAPPGTGGSDPWTDDLLRKAFREAEPPMREVLKYLAAQPGRRVPSQELIDTVARARGRETATATHSLLAGDIGVFARMVKHQYGLANSRGNAILPFENPRDERVGSRVYVMSQRVADVLAAI